MGACRSASSAAAEVLASQIYALFHLLCTVTLFAVTLASIHALASKARLGRLGLAGARSGQEAMRRLQRLAILLVVVSQAAGESCGLAVASCCAGGGRRRRRRGCLLGCTCMLSAGSNCTFRPSIMLFQLVLGYAPCASSAVALPQSVGS